MKNHFIRKIDKNFGRFKSSWKEYLCIDFFDSMNFLLFILGSTSLVICFFYNVIILSEFITTEILFLTFIAILQYTKETFHLRDIQQKTLNQQRIKVNFDLMPYLESKISYTDEKFITVLNRGRGLAKNVKLTIKYGDKKYKKDFFAIEAGEIAKLNHLKDHDFLSSFGSMDDKILKKVETSGEYADIADRKYQFRIIFERREDSFEVIYNEQKPIKWSVKKGLF